MNKTAKTLFQRPDYLKDPLYVIAPIFNPVRWRTRWKLYEDFCKRVAEAGAILYTVELAMGDREFAITSSSNPRHIQLRSRHELWLKENLINIAVSRLPLGWKYVAWIDADVMFTRDDWADETKHKLQRYDFLQLWSQFQDLTSNYELVGTAYSFVYIYQESSCCCPCKPCPPCPPNPYPYPYPSPHKKARKDYPGAPGLAWACRREAWDKVGGLIDFAILGSCDWYMAHGLIGRMDHVVSKDFHPQYQRKLLEWGDRAKSIKKNVGMVEGLALHYWHGPKSGRKYGTRDQILVKHQFDPDKHLYRDWQGVYQLDKDQIEMRDDTRRYLDERQEDTP